MVINLKYIIMNLVIKFLIIQEFIIMNRVIQKYFIIKMDIQVLISLMDNIKTYQDIYFLIIQAKMFIMNLKSLNLIHCMEYIHFILI